MPVRQAINYAIDTRTIVKECLDGYGVPVSTFQSAAASATIQACSRTRYDPTKAKALLAQAHLRSTHHPDLHHRRHRSVYKQVAKVMVAELQQVG